MFYSFFIYYFFIFDAMLSITISEKKLDKSNKFDEEFQESVIAALREPITQSDATNAFLIILGEGLRKLPYRQRAKLEIKFLTMVVQEQELLDDLNNDN